MSTKDKLIERFGKLPKDFTFAEMETLLKGLGFEKSSKGKTSGSRVRFINKEKKIIIDMHKPHGQGDPVKETALKDIYNNLFNNKLI
jgi:hypothetical protein